jgi:cobalt-zinc-cadmium efflux system outer membrane protein
MSVPLRQAQPRQRLLVVMLLWGFSLAAAAAPAAGDAQKIAESSETAVIVEQLFLPPMVPTQAVIAALPQVQAARAGVAVSQARGQRLAAGTYEWNLKIGTQQRREAIGPRYAEQELAMERSIRWGGKAETDRALGQAGVLVGQSAYADAWHEAVRALVKSWYDWQRERSASAVLAQQAALANEQLRVATRRVQAGDAPRMEQLMAQAEFHRAEAVQQQASGRAQVQRMELEKHYPGIALTDQPVGSPVAPDKLGLPGGPEVWLRGILDDNHEIELAEAELRLARLQSERARLDTRPDPLLGVRASRERGGQETVMGVYLSIPLSGAYRDADQRAALAQVDAAEQRLNLTRQRVEAAAQRAVLQSGHYSAVWQRLVAVQQSMSSVAQLAVKAYGQGEMSLSEALQTRRTGLEAALAADSARWDALESVSRVLVDAHRLWAADEPAHGH